MRISKIFLYNEPRVPEIKIEDLAYFINKKTKLKVEIRSNLLDYFNMKKDVAQKIAGCKILNPYVPLEKHIPSINEIALEEQYDDSLTHDTITLYDGFELQNIFHDIIPKSEFEDGTFHLVFTTRLTCTFDYDDYRYHGRAVICSNPAIISTTGIIEAPAKPREYYLRVYEKFSQGLNLDAIKDEFRGRFLEYHDENLGLVARGYALQAIFYYLTGETFCQSKDCMLYNSHWQEDLIHSQIKIGTLCDKHQKILESFAS